MESIKYSSFICLGCDKKLSDFFEFQSDLIDKQTRLYDFCEGDEENHGKAITKNEVRFIKVEVDADFDNFDEFPTHNYQETLVEPEIETLAPKLTCKVFGQAQKTRYALYSHTKRRHALKKNEELKQHSEEFAKQNMCSICGKIINNGKHGMNQHMQRAHSDFRYFCDLCPKKTKILRLIKQHVQTHIKLEHRAKLSCELCDKQFSVKDSVRKHMISRHQPDMPKRFECQCGKMFKTGSQLGFHQRQIHRTGYFPCEECEGKVFQTKIKLSDHFRQVHGKTFPCEICGKLIAGSRKVKRHMAAHGNPEFKCTYTDCPKAFFGKEALKNHIASRHETQKFICSNCGSAFSTMKNLRKHVQRQHKAEEIQCQVEGCSWTSKRRDYLKAHYEKHKDIGETTKNKLIEDIKSIKGIAW